MLNVWWCDWGERRQHLRFKVECCQACASPYSLSRSRFLFVFFILGNCLSDFWCMQTCQETERKLNHVGKEENTWLIMCKVRQLSPSSAAPDQLIVTTHPSPSTRVITDWHSYIQCKEENYFGKDEESEKSVPKREREREREREKTLKALIQMEFLMWMSHMTVRCEWIINILLLYLPINFYCHNISVLCQV